MILVAIGANLPDAAGHPALVTCRAAAEALRSLPGLRLVTISSWYRTAPVPPSGQPDYINGVAALEGTIAPATLLEWLQAIEARAGRVRSVPNAARTLDLDIIDLHGEVRPAPDPVLPHPRAHLRAFVLAPLREVAPDWVHPVLRRSVGDLLAGLGDQAISRL
ncbi:2-amino-4-hydroxy-6-hydroxymethyldihydropteridinepyrophosphokinase [Rhodovastum atsumiense]|uniref:2-amino-4-hydroxy-6-hydroxymethyldihydropteridine pyrophosphokinase n=1 Tax=Rhodovastum atsumiense TaxID=504468 RepID=A0A5M6IQI4_9PROT|nr:2-amino-4-hydroxy-6-hydroxymethyldihydropteridine diphosphokinase [Rhodovastum atsumiense]KAA5610536.1 2-amino-4-hydroxy-6-hydroxymethyldihydropteridine diphosphokinase [Rhodovastum atsumiense]CAH2605016.1 2-amino-4-hydroxy-6-hydroxymethyldihydropteridinepyrophosphokinase [Rhodovastum atsumiense]